MQRFVVVVCGGGGGIHVSNIWIYVIRPVPSAGQWSSVAKTLTLSIICTLLTSFLNTYHVYGHYWLQPFYTTLDDFDLSWGLQGQCKQTSWLHFVAHVSSDQDEIWYGVKSVETEHPDTSFEWYLLKKGHNCCFADRTKKKKSLTLSCTGRL